MDNGSSAENRRKSSEQLQLPRHRQSHSSQDAAPLSLTRTRSQELSVVESVAVQKPPSPQESKPASDDGNDSDPKPQAWPKSVRYLILLCAFLASLSFGVTQVPMLYVFRLMTCDAYYHDHPSQVYNSAVQFQPTAWAGSLLSYAIAPESPYFDLQIETKQDRCSIHPIESSTALSIALVGASTTIFGIMNLFLATSLIKRIGVKYTLLIQLFFPALRLLVQNVGVEVWGYNGIVIVQSSQILTIIGGPSGYLLVLNTFITEVVEYEGRTAALGRLTGSMMFGSAIGYLVGGLIAEAINIKAPFRMTLILFLLTCVYAFLFLPYIPPSKGKDDKNDSTTNKNSKSRFVKFFGSLMTFAPKKFIRTDGVIQTEYGAFLLAWGLYLGILATGYLPTLLQLYATDAFTFKTKENGWLIFIYSTLRGCFLTFAFPQLIAMGRKFNSRREEEARKAKTNESSERQPLLANPSSQDAGEDNDSNNKDEKKEQTFTFDLTYTKLSLLADGLLTLLCSFVHQGWQMYLVAVVLPFAAGTGSASKGTVLQMVGSAASSAERTDALAGVSLVENMARLSTSLVFGAIFAAFAGIGRTELVFTCNAAVALVGFCVLFFVRFPPEGARRYDEEEEPVSSS